MHKEDKYIAPSIQARSDMTPTHPDTFCIFKEEGSLYIYGESLTRWLSIGGLIRGDVKILWERGRYYYQASISSSVFFNFICDSGSFDVKSTNHGYQVTLKNTPNSRPQL